MDRLPTGSGGGRPQLAAARDSPHSGHHLPYSQTGIVCAISHEKPHHNTALEHFLPSGPFAQLPMCASRDAEEGGAANVSAIVWTERTAIARRMLELNDARLAGEITRRLGNHLGGVRAVGRRWSYPLVGDARAPVHDTRLALVGDAAHRSIRSPGRVSILGFAMPLRCPSC